MKKITLILLAMLSASTFAAEVQPVEEVKGYPTQEEIKEITESWTFPIYQSIAEQLIEDGLAYQEQQRLQKQEGESK
jgi:glutamyl/glutaminyl-tRNA synthetase